MMIAHDEFQAVHRAAAELELPLQNVEVQLVALGLALHRQDADDRIPGGDRVGVEVCDVSIDLQAPACRPLQGAGVAGDEPGGHYAALMV